MTKENLLNIIFIIPAVVLLVFGLIEGITSQVVYALLLVVSSMTFILTSTLKDNIKDNILKAFTLSSFFVIFYSAILLLFDLNSNSLFLISEQYYYFSILLLSGVILYSLLLIKNDKVLNVTRFFIVELIIIIVFYILISRLQLLHTDKLETADLFRFILTALIVIISVVNILFMIRNNVIQNKHKYYYVIGIILLMNSPLIYYIPIYDQVLFSNLLYLLTVIILLDMVLRYGILIPHEIMVNELKIKEQDLEHLIKIDPLTNLSNRQDILERYERIIRYSAREKQTVVVIVMDIDDFTNYNEVFGTAHGDSILTRLASTLKKECKRPFDIVGRIGGDEFLIILPNSDFKGGRVVTKRIEEAIRELRIVHYERDMAFLSCSIGFISITPDQTTELYYPLHEATSQMNKIKGLGKNSVLGIDLDKGEEE